MTANISLTSFIDFTSVTGSPRMKVPASLRAMYEDPIRHPWDYYGALKDAVVEGFRIDDVAGVVGRAVVEAQLREATGDMRVRGQGKNFAALAAGAERLRSRTGKVTVLDAPHGAWVHEELAVRVNPPLAVVRKTGAAEAWYLYLKDRGLTQAGADASLAIMTQVLTELDVKMIPRVIDLRTGNTFTLRQGRKVADLLDYAKSEAEAFMRLWDRAAA